MSERKRTKRQYRVSVNVPAWLVESINNANMQTSLSALIVKLLKGHMLDYELKQQFSKLNNRVIN
ncbi:conserved hypothetical protein [Pseudomonas sp. 8O]|nr:conserved hypothetical protein [Pseudomonas sp. 8O]